MRGSWTGYTYESLLTLPGACRRRAWRSVHISHPSINSFIVLLLYTQDVELTADSNISSFSSDISSFPSSGEGASGGLRALWAAGLLVWMMGWVVHFFWAALSTLACYRRPPARWAPQLVVVWQGPDQQSQLQWH